MRARPIYAFGLVLAFAAVVIVGQRFGDAWSGRPDLERVRPDERGLVRLDVGDIEPLDVRFYRFLNSGNQEVEFFVARDEAGVLQVAFNAGESHHKLRRGFSLQNGWVTDNKCETTTPLSEVNQGGSGCKPTPLPHRLEGDQLVLVEDDILRGWRYFR